MVDQITYDFFIIQSLYKANRDWVSTLQVQQARIHDACMAGNVAGYYIDKYLYLMAFRAFELIIEQIETLTNDDALSQQKALMNESEDIGRVRREASGLEDYLMGKELSKMGQGVKYPTFDPPPRRRTLSMLSSPSMDLQIAARYFNPTTVECRAVHDVARAALEQYCPNMKDRIHQLP